MTDATVSEVSIARLHGLVEELLYTGWEADGIGLLPAVRVLGLERGTGGVRGSGRRSASPAPWNNAIGNLLVDVHLRTREMYSQASVGDSRTLIATTDYALTAAMLERLPLLIGLVSDPQTRDAESLRLYLHLIDWRNRARLALREDRHDVKVRDADGHTMTCPVCERDLPEQTPTPALYLCNADQAEQAEVFCRACGSNWSVSELGWLTDLTMQVSDPIDV